MVFAFHTVLRLTGLTARGHGVRHWTGFCNIILLNVTPQGRGDIKSMGRFKTNSKFNVLTV